MSFMGSPFSLLEEFRQLLGLACELIIINNFFLVDDVSGEFELSNNNDWKRIVIDEAYDSVVRGRKLKRNVFFFIHLIYVVVVASFSSLGKYLNVLIFRV